MWTILLFVLTAMAQIKVPLRRTHINPTKSFDDIQAIRDLKFLFNLTSTDEDLENRENLEYYGHLDFGTPPKTFSFIFDTGSGWLWVPASNCTQCHKSKKFNESKSSTYSSTGERNNLYYGKGSASGIISTETVSIGDSEVTAIIQPFILVDSEEDNDGMNADGILGLGFSKLSDGYPTYMDTLKAEGALDNAIFSIFLNDDKFKNVDTKPESAIILGGYSLSEYAKPGLNESSIAWLEVLDTGYWSVSLDQLNYGANLVNDTQISAILDTGTSLIYGPSNQVLQIKTLLAEKHDCEEYQGMSYCKCSSVSDFEDLTFKMSGHEFSLESERFVLHSAKGVCTILILTNSEDFWLLGDIFLRKYYSIHDMDHMKVGLIEAADSEIVPNKKDDDDDDDDSSFATWKILVIIGSCIIGVCIVVFLVWKCRQRNKNLKEHYELLRITDK